MKKRIVAIGTATLLCMILSACGSPESAYEKGVAAFESKNYQKAIQHFTKAGDYEDAENMIAECEHMLAVAEDTTPPTVTGIDDVLEITCGTEFNLNDYLKDTLQITDDVTTENFEYDISCDEKAYERQTGKVITSNTGEFTVDTIVKDEAGNEAQLSFTLKLNPIHVTKDNLTPLVYDGEYAKITLLKSRHGYIDGLNCYDFIFEVENRTDELMDVYFGSSYTTINGYQINAYYVINSIGAGNIGRAEIMIDDEDIPENVGVIEQISTKLCLNNGGESSYYQIPMIIDTNIF